MTWLLTGGAGYIGAHVAHAFADAGIATVVLDDLSSGHREFLPPESTLIEGKVECASDVKAALDSAPVVGVVHLAGLKYASESVKEPLDYYRVNVEGTRVLLEQMQAANVNRLVFSSSAATYGEAPREVVDEADAGRPASPYGESKLIAEWLIGSQATANPALQQLSLRYFNVVGSGQQLISDHSLHNLFPRVFRALANGQSPVVCGDDYPTPDGSCVRDYVHVVDLAYAHLLAAQKLLAGDRVQSAYNVSRGVGLSVKEVMAALCELSGQQDYQVAPRRPGDPAQIVGSCSRIEADFGWKPELGLEQMVTSAWQAWQNHDCVQREQKLMSDLLTCLFGGTDRV